MFPEKMNTGTLYSLSSRLHVDEEQLNGFSYLLTVVSVPWSATEKIHAFSVDLCCIIILI